jgi:hypothetical protein
MFLVPENQVEKVPDVIKKVEGKFEFFFWILEVQYIYSV